MHALRHNIQAIIRGIAAIADWLCIATFIALFGFFLLSPFHASLVMMAMLAGIFILCTITVPSLTKHNTPNLVAYFKYRHPSSMIYLLALSIIAAFVCVLISLQLRGLQFLFNRHLNLSLHASLITSLICVIAYTLIKPSKASVLVQCLQLGLILTPIILLGRYMMNHGFDLPQIIRWPDATAGKTQISSPFSPFNIQPMTPSQPTTYLYWMLLPLITGLSILPSLLYRFRLPPSARAMHISTATVFVGLLFVFLTLFWVSGWSQLFLTQYLLEHLTHYQTWSELFSRASAWTGLQSHIAITASYTFKFSEVALLQFIVELLEMHPLVITLMSLAIFALALSTIDCLLTALRQCMSEVTSSSIAHDSPKHFYLIQGMIAGVIACAGLGVILTSTYSILEVFIAAVSLLGVCLLPGFILSLHLHIHSTAVITGILVVLILSLLRALMLWLEWQDPFLAWIPSSYHPQVISLLMFEKFVWLLMLVNITVTLLLHKLIDALTPKRTLHNAVFSVN